MTIDVRQATVDDAAQLSDLATTTFHEAYGSDNTAEDMAGYLSQTFTPERQADEIADPAGIVLLAHARSQDDASELVGYAHLAEGAAPGAVHGARPIELKRLYVTRAWQGRGVAQALMEAALRAAHARGAQTLWLGVWERNPRAIAFYAKYGFMRVGEHEFVLGADTQTDWLLARPVES